LLKVVRHFAQGVVLAFSSPRRVRKGLRYKLIIICDFQFSIKRITTPFTESDKKWLCFKGSLTIKLRTKPLRRGFIQSFIEKTFWNKINQSTKVSFHQLIYRNLFVRGTQKGVYLTNFGRNRNVLDKRTLFVFFW